MSWNCGCRDNRMDQDRMQYRLDDQEFVANLAKRGIGLDEIPEGEVFHGVVWGRTIRKLIEEKIWKEE